MSSHVNANYRVAPPINIGGGGVNKPTSRIAANLKYGGNVSTPLSSSRLQHESDSPFKRAGAFRSRTRANFGSPSGGVIAGKVKCCRNIQAAPSSSERKHRNAMLGAIKELLGWKSGKAPSKDMMFENYVVALPKPLTEVRRQEIKQAVSNEVKKFDFDGQVRGDEKFRDQAFKSERAAIFSRALDRVGNECNIRKLEPHIRQECFMELGKIAQDFGMEGKEKNGVFTPDGIGANAFIAAIMIPVLNRFKLEFMDNSLRSEMSQHAEMLVSQQLRDLALEYGMPDPQELARQLLHAEILRFPDYD
ncbi:SopE GEF domain-containing protein [Pseudomonas sp. LAMO17WK12:I10]|uniref:hypothetical protein n=1 Tax=unclassified Pseudomonas TaxID=196821 RepID=UPI000BC9E6D6|nr:MULTISPECIES: hypothetical protein [unclassified Pseudomonas]PXX54016.1 SopE GEF domain-containing protein [Pseudomonas sp. LAMO17WK12:I9]SNY51964.1 SopE GEF domain-containing protein [Pseudomonas sp. LAMO17WK12:I10]